MERAHKGTPVDGYSKLLTDLHRSAERPDNPYIHSFAVDFLYLLRRSAKIAGRVNAAYELRQKVDKERERSPVTASYAGNIALRSVHTELFEREGYPYTHSQIGTWLEDIEESVVSGKFQFDVGLRDVMSNIPSRYSSLKVLADTLESRQQRPISILDIGASQNHGLKMIASRAEFATPQMGKFSGRKYEEHLNRQTELGQMVGVDTWNIDKDPETRAWARACSMPPHEMVDKQRLEQYEHLDNLHLENVSIYQAEIGTDLFGDDDRDIHNRFDIVFMSTVLYQMSNEKIARAWQQAYDCLSDGGIIVVQDHLTVSGNNQFKPVDNWKNEYSYPYRTIVHDSNYPEDGLVEVFKWTSGRCKKGKVAGIKGFNALKRLTR